MRKFLITGLPRSRTAWFSTMFNHNGSVCYHEPFADFKNLDDAVEFYNKNYDEGTKAIGMSDSAALMFVPQLKVRIPDLKVLVINRNLSEVNKSLERAGLTSIDIPPRVCWVATRLADYRLNFSSKGMDSCNLLSWVFHKFTGQMASVHYIEQLLDMNVQLKPEVIDRRIERFLRNFDHEEIKKAINLQGK